MDRISADCNPELRPSLLGRKPAFQKGLVDHNPSPKLDGFNLTIAFEGPVTDLKTQIAQQPHPAKVHVSLGQDATLQEVKGGSLHKKINEDKAD